MADNERRRYERIRLDGRMVGRATLLADFRIDALSETGATLTIGVPMTLGSSCSLTLNLSHVSIDLTGRADRGLANRDTCTRRGRRRE